MITRSLSIRIRKARLDVVMNDKNVKICDTFQDLIEVYTRESGLIYKNPKLIIIETAKYKKMMKELSEKIKDGDDDVLVDDNEEYDGDEEDYEEDNEEDNEEEDNP